MAANVANSEGHTHSLYSYTKKDVVICTRKGSKGHNASTHR